MAIAFVNGATGSFSGYPASPQTLATLDVGTGTDRALFVHVVSQSATGNTLNGCTVGGVSLTTPQYSVTGATRTNPCEITSPNHGLLTNDKVRFSSVGGMTQLNGNWYTVTPTGTNTFTIGVDATAYGTYTSGGTFEALHTYSSDDYYKLYYLLGSSLPTGSQSVVLSFASGSVSIVEAAVAVFSGVQSVSFPKVVKWLVGGTTTPSVTVATTAGDLAVAMISQQPNTTAVATFPENKHIEVGMGTYRLITLSETATSSSTVVNYTTASNVFPEAIVYSLTPTSGSSNPTITDAGDETYLNGEVGITITGSNFEASQGTGFVKISPTNDINDVNAVSQTINGWGSSSINITAVRGALAANTNMYLFVKNNSGLSNSSGYVVQFLPDKKLKVLVHSSAASATNVKGVVFNAPTGAEITGTEIGEFTGKTFEASLESGQAVLKVNVLDFGGGSLATGATPVVLVRNDTNTTGIISATIIEE